MSRVIQISPVRVIENSPPGLSGRRRFLQSHQSCFEFLFQPIRMATNEAPPSKLRGITELKHSELPEIVVGLPLPLHIPFDRLTVRLFPHRRHIVPVSPKFPAPQYPFHSGFPSKDFPGCKALEDLHNPSRSYDRKLCMTGSERAAYS